MVVMALLLSLLLLLKCLLLLSEDPALSVAQTAADALARILEVGPAAAPVVALLLEHHTMREVTIIAGVAVVKVKFIELLSWPTAPAHLV